MLSEKLGHKFDRPLSIIITKSFLARFSPTTFTVTGLFISLIAAGSILYGYWKTAAILILVAGLFDMLDGAAARTLKKTSQFGGFIDSVVDRYSDMVIIIAFIIYYARYNDIFMVSLCAVTSVGFVLIPYARAKAETLISNCNIGLMERAERILLLSAGCYFNCVKPVFWILAISTHLTVFQRIYHTWKETRKI